MGIFRACKKIKANRNGRDFKQEYLMLRKRAKSQGITNDQFSTPRGRNMNMKDSIKDNQPFDQQKTLNFEEKYQTVRAKSIENKRRRLLAESIRFQRRVEIMRKRRAQYFAPGIKNIGIPREEIVKDYDDYVKRKYKIKCDPTLINEEFTKKRQLYRSASTEALIRYCDVQQFEASNPLADHKKKHKLKPGGANNFDLRSHKSRD